MSATRSTVRKSVPLDENDIKDLTAIRMQGSDEAVALHSLTGIVLGERPSEAEALHALVTLGRQTLADRKTEIGYQKLARFMEDDPESQAWHASRRARARDRQPGASSAA